MKDDFTIIDGHVHTFSSDEIAVKIINSFNKLYDIHFNNSGTGTPEDLIKIMSESGIDYSITANFAPAKILHLNNMWTINSSRKYPNLIPLVSFHPDMEGNLSSLLEQYVAEGTKGVKLHPMAQCYDPNTARMHEVYSFCNSTGLPVVFHCGRVSNARLNPFSDVDTLIPIVEKYSNIPFIFTHMADGNEGCVRNLAHDFENIYFDTSIVITGSPSLLMYNKPSWPDDNVFIDIMKDIGAGRFLFGSDYPWGSPKHDVNRIINMKLDADSKRLILSGNIQRIFKL